MATSFNKLPLSGSANGRGIKVAGTATGTSVLIHEAVTGTTNMDEIWLWAVNQDTVARTLTLEYGGTTAPDFDISIPLEPGKGMWCVIPGLLLQNALSITAFCSAENVVSVYGYVNRLSVS